MRVFAKMLPLAMVLFCIFYGVYIFTQGDAPSDKITYPVIFGVGVVCLSIFALIYTVIRQTSGMYDRTGIYLASIVSYLLSFGIFVCGVIILSITDNANYFVAAHIISGLGLIACCVSTLTVISTRFSLIKMSHISGRSEVNARAFSANAGGLAVVVVVFMAIVAWVWSIAMLYNGGYTSYFVSGSVMGGIAAVCTAFVALVVVLVRQQRGIYTDRQRRIWPWLAISVGMGVVIWGLMVIIFYYGQTRDFVGFILIGFGLLCFAIASCVAVMTRSHNHEYDMASRVRFVPILMALCLLLLSSLLFEQAVRESKFAVVSRMLVGLGALSASIFGLSDLFYTILKRR